MMKLSGWKEVNIYSGQEIDEDAPTTSAGAGGVAGIGVPMPGEPASSAEPGIDPKKRKKKKQVLIGGDGKFDGRTKAYRDHRKKLEAAREARKKRKSKFIEKIVNK